MERDLNLTLGVVDNGLFPRFAHALLVGSSTDGSVKNDVVTTLPK